MPMVQPHMDNTLATYLLRPFEYGPTLSFIPPPVCWGHGTHWRLIVDPEV